MVITTSGQHDLLVLIQLPDFLNCGKYDLRMMSICEPYDAALYNRRVAVDIFVLKDSDPFRLLKPLQGYEM